MDLLISTETVSYPAALLAGLLSFFSPCILPLIPAYFVFITGYSLDELTQGADKGFRKKVLMSTCSFVMGFSFIFILMGASATLFGGLIDTYKDQIRIIGGMIVLVMGLHLIGVFRIPLLNYEKRIHLDKKPLHFLGTFIVGMAFGAGWSPCIGPLLGAILILASNQETITQGMALLGIYAFGLAVPFITLSVFINFLLVFIKKAGKTAKYLNKTAGALLIMIGGLLIFNMLNL
jgi:cytochrome c-type biogenesis protein